MNVYPCHAWEELLSTLRDFTSVLRGIQAGWFGMAAQRSHEMLDMSWEEDS